MVTIIVNYELQGDLVRIAAHFDFLYYSENGGEIQGLNYRIEFNNGDYQQNGRLDYPDTVYSFLDATMDGLTRLQIDGTEQFFGGSATVVENIILALQGSSPVNGTPIDDVLFAGEHNGTYMLGEGNNTARLGDGNDAIVTGSGVDYIDGEGGADRMEGGGGGDTYVVDNPGDAVIERGNGGFDTILASIDFSLPTSVECLTLLGGDGLDGTGNGIANVLRGNAADNTLLGLGGNDTLYGNGGLDRLEGGIGNDTYHVDADDVVVEAADAGIDTIVVASTYSLVRLKDVENITLDGDADYDATGNDAANVLTGTPGSNILNGRGGADRMTGGFGNDIYVVDNEGDRVVETSTRSFEIDTVRSTISFKLGMNLENLLLLGDTDIAATGNASKNVIRGNLGDNIIKAGDGADQVTGGKGDDDLWGNAGADRFIFGGGDGDDTIRDFQNNADRIDLRNVAGVNSFNDLTLTDTGPGVMIDYHSGTVLLANVANFALIDQSDFMFS